LSGGFNPTQSLVSLCYVINGISNKNRNNFYCWLYWEKTTLFKLGYDIFVIRSLCISYLVSAFGKLMCFIIFVNFQTLVFRYFFSDPQSFSSPSCPSLHVLLCLSVFHSSANFLHFFHFQFFDCIIYIVLSLSWLAVFSPASKLPWFPLMYLSISFIVIYNYKFSFSFFVKNINTFIFYIFYCILLYWYYLIIHSFIL
jgi:hypothetical protein